MYKEVAERRHGCMSTIRGAKTPVTDGYAMLYAAHVTAASFMVLGLAAQVAEPCCAVGTGDQPDSIQHNSTSTLSAELM